MDSEDSYPLIVIVGETGSGKSALALKLAKRFRGEIISGDSRALYKGMDIGTSKPSLDDQKRIPHHLIDVAFPDQPWTVSDFKVHAEEAIKSIAKRNRLPILVGGSGLYVDSIVFDFQFSGPANKQLRKKNQSLSVSELQQKIVKKELELPYNKNNRRHLIQQLERGNRAVANKSTLRPNTLVIGLMVDRDELKQLVSERIETMLEDGLEKEAISLGTKYGWDLEPLKAIGYQEFADYTKGDRSLQETRELIQSNTLRYARRQRTWLKRNINIRWVVKQREVVDLVTTFLNK